MIYLFWYTVGWYEFDYVSGKNYYGFALAYWCVGWVDFWYRYAFVYLTKTNLDTMQKADCSSAYKIASVVVGCSRIEELGCTGGFDFFDFPCIVYS